MVNILLEGYDIDAPWLYGELNPHIRPSDRVAVVAFSFRDTRVKTAEDWDRLYSKESGMYYGGITGGFAAYGIPESQISFLDYFRDTKEAAAEKVENADILYFLGGLPDRMLDRIEEFALTEPLLWHRGVVMGYSAGAVIQLAEYHLSPDEDYPEFAYYRGLPYLKDFYLEVHYEGTEVQNASIRRVLAERGKPVYATALRAGALIAEDGRVKPLGKVKVFEP
ncbi:MAG: Type 1 glutamine amidotransferase-like domain-containing protein [Oscillospiraceae bacterium]|nr:Type 1 glutamine amidotransferase-like domain-containing protein [Oscillospiraceae bacterium]